MCVELRFYTQIQQNMKHVENYFSSVAVCGKVGQEPLNGLGQNSSHQNASRSKVKYSCMKGKTPKI